MDRRMGRTWERAVRAVAALLAAPAILMGQAGSVPAQAQMPDGATLGEYFDRQMPAYLSEFGIAGAVTAVVQDGEVVHLGGYGFANVEEQRPMDPERTVVHIGSLGKTFTATAVMQLAEQGLIDLDEDVNAIIDFEIPATYEQPVTIRHLLTHTPGFEARDIGAILVQAEALPSTREYLVRNLPERVRPPGEAIGYSNYGLALLGYVAERASGMALGEYLARNITGPLGMVHTITEQIPTEDSASDLATGYAGMQPQPAEYIAAFGAGPVRSTAADMAAYMMASLNLGRLGEAEILQAETAIAMQDSQFRADARLNGTGFGFYEMGRNGERIVGHLGSTANFHSVMLLFPERRLGVFVAFNSAEAAGVLRTSRFLDDLMGEFFAQTVTAVQPPADFAERAGDYAGTYFWNNRHGQTTYEKALFLFEAVTIQPTADGRLRVASGGSGRTFTETEQDFFVSSDGSDWLVFYRDGAGRVTGASQNSRAVFTLEKRAWYEAPWMTWAVLAVCGVVFVAGLAINGAGLWCKRGGREAGSVRTGRWLAVAMALVNLVFLPAFVTAVGALLGGQAAGAALHLVLLLPAVGALLTLALAGLTALSWVRGEGALSTRVQWAALAAAGAAYALALAVWNLEL